MRTFLSQRAVNLSPSPTMAIDAKAKQMKADGIDVIGFGAGEPDFDTPQHVKQAGIKAIEEGFTKYTPAAGTLELRKSICEKLQRDNGLDYKPSQIVVSNGAKHSLYNAMQVLVDDGDEVIVPAPYWVSYNEQIKLCGGVPVIVEAEAAQGFRISPEQLDAAVTARTKAVIINSPSNPTGIVYDALELKALAEVIVRHGIICISDEIYEKLIYEGEHVSIASFNPEIKKLTIVINGLSKSHCMTGWRIGYAAAEAEIAVAMADLQSQTTSNPSSISQMASLAALAEEPCTRMIEEFRRRRDYMVDVLNSIEGIDCLKPPGAFYVFPDISGLFGRGCGGRTIESSSDLADYLLEEVGVAVVPGMAFGADNCIRLSYATSMDNIEEGLRRIGEAIERFSM
ncbi:MAG: pyridoxal phosphate-dependent aminotransferase [bacterium]|nr:pyridoxal phosphate-dependent aminotransferase [bacterium]